VVLGTNVTFEVIKYTSIFIAEEMGIELRNTAYSPNIKDRLDHSCAILSPQGGLVAQAEHIPVHLGSMAIGVMNTIEYLKKMEEELQEGDVVIVNDPYIAGTHLNDILLLKPVYYNGDMVAIVANKAHHVDIGGIVPGSIGGNAREMLQEGLVIPPLKIVKNGRIQKDIIRLIEANVRTPKYLHGDLRAQIASLNVGEKRIKEMIMKYGKDTVLNAWRELLDYVERYTKSKIREHGKPGIYEAEDYIELSDNTLAKIKVKVKVEEESIIVDYNGTNKQVNEPVNAVYGVTVAATTFALKSVIDPEMPMNHGFYRVVKIGAPLGSLVNPKPPAPVSGGNVETSQRIVDVVFLALAQGFPGRVPAASCGSMNNVMVGGVHPEGTTWAFYETVGGGSGGRPGADGVDGVHTNMTNTLNTPIEILEKEYPILFMAYSLRQDSCGAGEYRGGLGITRAFKVLEDNVVLTIMAERVRTRPWGLMGGKPGAPGYHYVIRANGTKIVLKSKDTIVLGKGDIVYINTPGGGGYGPPELRDRRKIVKDLIEERISQEHAKQEYKQVIIEIDSNNKN